LSAETLPLVASRISDAKEDRQIFMDKQELRSLAQRRLAEIRNKASRRLAAANPGEVGEEAPSLEETFERAAEPAPGLQFKRRTYKFPLGWCLTNEDRSNLDAILFAKLPRSHPADPFPPTQIDLLKAYRQTLHIVPEFLDELVYMRTPYSRTKYPDYGDDPKWVPHTMSMPITDFPQFLRKWCGVSAREGEDSIPLQQAVQVVNLLRRARKQVLEVNMTRGAFLDLVLEQLDNPRSWSFPYLESGQKDGLSEFGQKYKQYVEYADSVMTGVGQTSRLERLSAVLEEHCKARWNDAKKSYIEALSVLGKLNAPQAQEAKAVIEAELRQLSGMYASRWPTSQ
jgi:hypothetical protein